MKSYILRSGCRYTLVDESDGRSLFSAEVARTNMCFEDKELVGVDTIDSMLHFKVGNKHYYANTNSVSVLH